MRKYNNKHRVLIFSAKFYSATFRFTVIVVRKCLKIDFYDFRRDTFISLITRKHIINHRIDNNVFNKQAKSSKNEAHFSRESLNLFVTQYNKAGLYSQF